MKILLVGFSVIEQKQGVSQAIKELEMSTANDISFDFCAMGGHHIQTISYLASDIFTRDTYDVVLLDITSSSIRSNFNNPVVSKMFNKHLSAILEYLKQLGIMAGLIHFYRKDIDYSNDILVQQCSELANRFNIPTLELGKMINEIYSDDQIELLFKDVVHTTLEGSKLYAEKILEFLEKSFCHQFNINKRSAITDELILVNKASIEPEFLAVPLKNMIAESALNILPIKRHGLVFECVYVDEGESITIELNPSYKLDGIIAVIGPRSGAIEITSESGEKSTVMVYDKYAYYERLGSFSCKNMHGRISLKQLSKIPDIELLKGEKNTEKRIGKISHLNLSRISKN